MVFKSHRPNHRLVYRIRAFPTGANRYGYPPVEFSLPIFSREAEVTVMKTYHYSPCPIAVDPAGFNGELLHYLWEPGQQLDRLWPDFFPKKLS